MTIPELYNIYKQHPGVQTDSRKVKAGEIFFALKGDHFNGNAFAKQAIDKGASFSVIDEQQYLLNGKTILVDDVLKALQELALFHRQQFNIPFLAITGSNGKTTTKELIHAVLSSTFRTYTTEGNLNNHIGVPLTLLKIRDDAEIAVVEMGANHLGEIASYCRICLPTHGLITNCGKAHLEGFGSVEGVKKGKGELYDHLRAHNGFAFVMWDYEYLREMSKGIPAVFKYGTGAGDITGEVESGEPFLNVKLTKGIEIPVIKTRLVGSYNLPNVLAAVAVGKQFGLSPEKISSAISNYVPSNSRSQLLQKGSNQIILDAYNANPSSMKLAIENFAGIDAKEKVLVLGAMAELGQESLKEHQAIIELLKKYKWKDVLLTGGDFRKIKHPYHSFENAADTADWLKQQQYQHSYFLIKGSRSSQMEKVLEAL
jgi:UDP-N-acetylmuramoyl-tripeptide--D-alanyl-D-alanine ligase